MSIHLKLFSAFSAVVALAVGTTYYGIRATSEAGGLVVQLYDGPFMAVSHARAAQARFGERARPWNASCRWGTRRTRPAARSSKPP
jgi:hypothetical protein